MRSNDDMYTEQQISYNFRNEAEILWLQDGMEENSME